MSNPFHDPHSQTHSTFSVPFHSGTFWGDLCVVTGEEALGSKTKFQFNKGVEPMFNQAFTVEGNTCVC